LPTVSDVERRDTCDRIQRLGYGNMKMQVVYYHQLKRWAKKARWKPRLKAMKYWQGK
jgi:hypothetical protein